MKNCETVFGTPFCGATKGEKSKRSSVKCRVHVHTFFCYSTTKCSTTSFIRYCTTSIYVLSDRRLYLYELCVPGTSNTISDK